MRLEVLGLLRGGAAAGPAEAAAAARLAQNAYRQVGLAAIEVPPDTPLPKLRMRRECA